MSQNKSSEKAALEFPSLFSGEEIDSQFLLDQQKAAAASKAEDYHPLPIVQTHYPRIAEIITGMWGTPELDHYLDKILIDERGDRAGFPPEVVRALLALSRQHIEQFGFRSLSDVWTVNPNTRA